ncbi:MAG: hypothetical protein HYZ53_09170 [Planctomycetes bacterium]|nr:hypothetical protein [Planctomycetota bacterium]
MSTEYTFDKGKKACSKCARDFASGEEFVSTLHAAGEAFERRNWCRSCWTTPAADVFSFWKARMPERATRRPDNRTLLLQVFENRLRQEPREPAEAKLTYLLALILVQKRQFRLRDSVRRDGVEYLDLLKVADDRTLLVPVAPIADEEIDGLKTELEKLLETGPPAAPEEGAPGG